jgi:hypothetical protein
MAELLPELVVAKAGGTIGEKSELTLTHNAKACCSPGLPDSLGNGNPRLTSQFGSRSRDRSYNAPRAGARPRMLLQSAFDGLLLVSPVPPSSISSPDSLDDVAKGVVSGRVLACKDT